MLAYFSDKIITRNGIRRNLTSEIGFPIIGQQYEFTLKTQNIFNIKQYIYILLQHCGGLLSQQEKKLIMHLSVITPLIYNVLMISIILIVHFQLYSVR
jgi:hypothetical protein